MNNFREQINGIGPQAAKAFYEAGFKTIEDIANLITHFEN